jgi:hypothetical protein
MEQLLIALLLFLGISLSDIKIDRQEIATLLFD